MTKTEAKLRREHARCKRTLSTAKVNHRPTKTLQKDLYRITGEILREEKKKTLPLLKRAA